MSDESPQTCPQCGASLEADAPAGLCPNCLMALNLRSETVFTDAGAIASPPLAPDEFAQHFPQLEIIECLGRGGMGVVYKARQRTLNRVVALKLLAPERVGDAKFAERFAREARALAALNHPNIVTIHDFGRAGGFYYLLMEFVDGLNLRQLFRTRKLTPEEALAIVPPLCDALQFAHDRGVVHRDIKPENLLLDKDGRVKVADFGIAKMMDVVDGEEATRESAPPEDATRSTVGTPGYSAPEQKTDPGSVDSRADVYSLGVVFYEMLTGELPGEHIAPPSHKVRIDVRLDEVVLRALETKPDLRYQQVSEVKTRVETIATTGSADDRSWVAKSEAGLAAEGFANADSTARSSRPEQVPGRIKVLVIVLILALPAMALIGNFFIRSHPGELRPSSGGTLELTPPDFFFSAFQLRLVADESDADERTETMTYMDDGREAETLRLVPSVLLDGRVVERAGWRAEMGPTNLVVGLTEEGSRAFESLTATNVGRQIAIVFQNKVLSAPVIRDRISTRQLDFTHTGSRPDLEHTITILNRLNNPSLTLQFGPLQEPVVPRLVGARWTTFLNLGANRLMTSPHRPGESRDFHDWLNKSGANLRAVAEPRAPGLVAYGMTLVPAPDRDFNQVSAADIRYNWNLMMDQPNHLLILGKGYGTDHDTYLFRTRDDNWGVLQIMGNSDTPPGVKIRYKLVEEMSVAAKEKSDDQGAGAGASASSQHFEATSVFNSLQPATPATKTIVLSRATNSIVGETTNVWSVLVISDTRLQPNENLRAIVVTQAGEISTAMSSRHTKWRETGVTTSTAMFWIFKDGFGADEAQAAVAQMRNSREDRPIELTAGQPLELFSVTNRLGGVMAGLVEFVRTDPRPRSGNADPATKPKAVVRINNFTGFIPSVNYSADVPPGYALRGTASEGEVFTHVTFGEREYGTTWFPPRRLRLSAQDRSRQAILESQLDELRRGGPLEVVLDEPTRLFSLTNDVGEVLHGFLELVGPADTAGSGYGN